MTRASTVQRWVDWLGTSPRTVAKHQGNIYRKLGVNDRLTAVLVAQQLGILRASA